MSIKIINPVTEKRWDEFVLKQTAATVFHTSAWAKALIEAYGYLPRYMVLEDEKGEISAGDNLIVGEEGMIEANLHAAHIVISGEVHGNIVADQRVDIHPPGKVFGNIQAPAVVIDEGVIFEGKTRMYQAKDMDDKASETVDSEERAEGPPVSLGGVYGIVTDQNTGRPIKNAEIKCEGMGKKHTLTSASGYYELMNLQDGHWKRYFCIFIDKICCIIKKNP